MLTQAGGCAPAPLFQIRDAQVVRTGKTILHVGDFSLDEGEHVALLGPNGAGKSTFIQLLTREVFPLFREEPPVRFRGQARPLLEDIRSSLGIVSACMHDHVRVERLGIGDLANRDIMTLSTGQVRRVLVARELVRDPQVLVFDEPCTGLDPQGMYHLRQIMSTLAEDGRSIILVTHYPEDIVPEIDRILLIKDAAVFADGSKERLLTSEVMSDLFSVPLTVAKHDGWYSLY